MSRRTRSCYAGDWSTFALSGNGSWRLHWRRVERRGSGCYVRMSFPPPGQYSGRRVESSMNENPTDEAMNAADEAADAAQEAADAMGGAYERARQRTQGMANQFFLA